MIDSCKVGGFGTPVLISATTLNSFATANYTWAVNSATSSFAAVAFDATTSTNATTYTWNIGDNSAAGTGATPTHQYVINGSWNLY